MKFSHSLLAGILLASFFSCSENTEDQGAEDPVEQISPADSVIISMNSSSDSFPSQEPTERFHFLFGHLLQKEYDTLSNSSFHFLERFEFSSVEKIRLKKQSGVSYGEIQGIFPEAAIWMFRYPDTLKRFNAMNNWLNCYGRDCTPVKFKEPLKAVKTIPSWALIKDSLIIVMEWPCEHKENDWQKITRMVDSSFSENNSTILRVDCGGPLEWE